MMISITEGIDYPGVGLCAMIWGKPCDLDDDVADKVLIMKRGQDCRHEKGKWAFPGGGLEHGEHLVDAIKREVKEELNVNVDMYSSDMMFVCEDMIHEDDKLHHWITICYECEIQDNWDKDICNMEGFGKCEAIVWIDPFDKDLFEKYEFSAFTEQALKYFLREEFGVS